MVCAAVVPVVAGERSVCASRDLTVAPAARPPGRTWRRLPLVIGFYGVLYVAFFAPVLLSNRLLAPLGDGLSFFVPVVCSGPALWTPSLFAGYPLAADPQAMSWYPPALLFGYPDGRWNVLVLLAYVLASTWTFLLLRALTGCDFAALVSGIVYGMSGFFMSHLGHTNIIHSAAWLPLIVLGIHQLRGGFQARWVCTTALGTALCVLGGHPQIATYCLTLGALYAVFQGRQVRWGRWRYYGTCAAVMGVGMGLAAVQIVPTLELAGQSMRATLSYKEFTELYLPSNQLPMLVLPWAYGGSGAALYGLAYFGKWNCVELTGYVGLVPLTLALVLVVSRRKEPEAWFWIVTALAALLLALGRRTPLAAVLYRVPPYNLFRGPARHLLEYTFAISVLSGLGIARLQRLAMSLRRVKVTHAVMCFAALFAAATCKLLLDARGWEQRAQTSGVAALSMLPWKNAAVGVPFVVAVVGAASVYWWSKSGRLLPAAVITGVIVLDLGSCGWFHSWRYDAPHVADAAGGGLSGPVKRVLQAERQRVAHWDVGHMSMAQAPPNVSLLRGLPEVGGYNPLRLRRHAELLDAMAEGGLSGTSLRGASQAANLLGARYLLLPRRADAPPSFVRHGATWSEKDWELDFGRNCPEPSEQEVPLRLPGVAGCGFAVVSCMGHAARLPDGAPVLAVDVEQADGTRKTYTLRAGIHTAETAWERLDHNGAVAHRMPSVFRSFRSMDANGVACRDHHYVASIAFASPRRVQRMRLRWVGPDGVLLKLFKLTLLGSERAEDFPVTESASIIGDSKRWRPVADGIWENREALPRAWLTRRAVCLDAHAVREVVDRGVLPDGTAFDPKSTALVEEPVRLGPEGSPGPGGTVEVVRATSTGLELSTRTTQAELLITSDVYYPGWRATIDGVPTHMFRTNYLLRGVVVPAGNHTVRFVFRPTSFYIGCAVTALAAAGLAAMVAGSFLGGRRDGGQPQQVVPVHGT